MHSGALVSVTCLLLASARALRYDPLEVEYNLNQNETATIALDYWGEWDNHTYHKSPDNWRFPFYSFFIDRFVNGDPSNDNANGTAWEHDPYGTQLRHGGDMKGVADSLDYLQGLGIKGIYLAGSPFINVPWAADSYSPLDHSLLDKHFGTIEDLRQTITAIHDRQMYVILDNTMATMGDLLAFDGYLNTSTPWAFGGHDTIYKDSRQYLDYHPNDEWIEHCEYPRFWNQLGERYDDYNTSHMVGCRAGDFDQYGDVSAFGAYPEWQKQLSKFASVQDRLSEWKPSVLAKIIQFSCIQIAQLDIDGFRMDKALQITVDPQSDFSAAMRQCARRFGKENFFIPGEIVNGNLNAAIYVGRGKEPSMKIEDPAQAINPQLAENSSLYIRDAGKGALDAAAFHYTTYRGLQRFLGLDGKLSATGEAPINFVDQWTEVQQTNDFVNANTGEYDPRHMYGVSNQDVFRWPGITQGTERQLLGMFVTTIEMPGIPLLSWGEEQAFYTLDNTASNYVFGRQAMTSSQAWQMHGCYKVGDVNIFDMPFNKSLTACQDPGIVLDHRDPSHPLYNVYKSMFETRSRYPVLNDGWTLTQFSNQSKDIFLPGSGNVPTETGLWSVARSRARDVQDFTGTGQGNQSIWLIYSNKNTSETYEFDCNSTKSVGLRHTEALLSPFDTGITVKNLFYPYEEYTLGDSSYSLGEYLVGSDTANGCLPSINMPAYGFKAFVPKSTWLQPSPRITKFLPGHDFRYLSTVAQDEKEMLQMQLHFSSAMDCQQVSAAISFSSTTADGSVPKLQNDTVKCIVVPPSDVSDLNAVVPTTWEISFNISNVANGIHTLTVNNASSADGTLFTNSVDNLLFRVGQSDNPMVFPYSANYSSSLYFKDGQDAMTISHKAVGANKFRYSTNWGSSWSNWLDYDAKNTNTTVQLQAWIGTSSQSWSGDHIKVQYWSQKAGSSDHIQEGDVEGSKRSERRWPHLFIHGPFNQFGYDAGFFNIFRQDSGGYWNFNFMTEWPAQWQANVWGINPDGFPDATAAYGDVDGDNVLDRIPPITLEENLANITSTPPLTHLAWWIHISDADLRYWYVPIGSAGEQLALYILLLLVPTLTALGAVYMYHRSFYQVKHNKFGILDKGTIIPIAVQQGFYESKEYMKEKISAQTGRITRKFRYAPTAIPYVKPIIPNRNRENIYGAALGPLSANTNRRRVLIATMEYNIEDWAIKIKIGGLGVMSQLMGQNLGHQDLVWVVPCVGGVEYPVDEPAEDIIVTIYGEQYHVEVQYHQVKNVMYVLLDAPVFRKQTKAEPYPARMDDLDSATYYSAWNQCIAETINRFSPDLYHINDYHGTIAPLYLLPRTLPCCLSLHNAEFQGLWPLRTRDEKQEVASVYNLPEDVISRYVQFGEVFNLLHAGASLLRINQQGFGAVGVSTKYGKRAFARYPIFWGLKEIGGLPNPDPTDLADLDTEKAKIDLYVSVDNAYESTRAEPKRQAQEWANLEQRADAELFVFVGRWSEQKGVDLIADVFPSILEQYEQVQLICIGPVIDLYGKFAALKLAKLMTKYPGRVYSKPEFTALPPYIFTGAEFALIPSRDEPFGLVAVEFGRKGALGVGSRVGGLGQMPGWWYTVESTTSRNLLRQFKHSIKSALASKPEARAKMRAISAKQRFPVAQWKRDLEILQSTSIKLYNKVQAKQSEPHRKSNIGTLFGWSKRLSGSTIAGEKSITSHSEDIELTESGSSRHNSAPVYASQDSLPMGRETGPTAHAAEANNARTQWRGLDPTMPNDLINKPAVLTDAVMDSYLFSPEDVESRRNERIYVLDQLEDDDIRALREARAHSPDDEITPMPHHGAMGYASVDNGSLYSPRGTGTATPVAQDYEKGAQARQYSVFPPSSPEARTPSPTNGHREVPSRTSSRLSVTNVLGVMKHSELQKVEPFFTDPTGIYYRMYEDLLEDLDGKNSQGPLCVEEYLMASEKDWFGRFHNAKMGRASPVGTPRGASPTPRSGAQSPTGRTPSPRSRRSPWGGNTPAESAIDRPLDEADLMEADLALAQFALPDDYETPTGMKRLMLMKIGDWPLYTFLLALGQIIAANSYQITLLTGEVGQKPSKLYIVASIYLATSCLWWLLFRKFAALYVLSGAWFFYGLAFFLLGMAPWSSSLGRTWIQNVATGFYAAASSSSSFFFGLNFGSEGSATIQTWAFRACVIQGTQQLYVTALWYWGARINNATVLGQSVQNSLIAHGWPVTAITVPIAFLLWAIGLVLYLGLPSYYRQTPGNTPSFYRSILKRKIILWFFLAVILQNLFMSAPTGRNWTYLWSSQHAPDWAVLLLVLFFFVVVWAGLLLIFAHLSATHSWILPVFGVGLGAPRWAQMLWGVSGIGVWVPWAGGSYIASALVGRVLWLWLGVMDVIQGVGFGMILLQTLTRLHMTFALIAAQVIGSVATIVARACVSDNVGPGDVFPNMLIGRWMEGAAPGDWGWGYGLGRPWFWIGLLCQLVIPVGFLMFFRKEQLSKP